MHDYEVKKMRVNGLDFSYLEKGRGELMLFLHGFPDHAPTFQRQLDLFGAQGYHAVAPYMRGYTPETVEADSFQTARLGQDVLGIIEALGYDEAILVGHDWGAAAANIAALINPAKIKKLVTSAVTYGTFAAAMATNYEQQKRSWYMYLFQFPHAEKLVEFNELSFIERLWDDWSYRCPQAEAAQAKECLKRPGVLNAALNYYRQAFTPAKNLPELAELQSKIGTEKIDVDTLHIHGREDGCIGVALCDGLEQFYSGSFRLRIIEQAGHFVHLEQPEQFNRAVLEFIS